jgi:hypothetical protein
LAVLCTQQRCAWRQALGEKIFKLPHGAPTFSPTFRSMLGFFARRRDDGGFQEPESFSADADAGDLRTGLSYMFGLDWEIPRKIRESREKERSLKALRKELKRGVYGRVMEPASELKSRVAVTERRLSKLDAGQRDTSRTRDRIPDSISKFSCQLVRPFGRSHKWWALDRLQIDRDSSCCLAKKKRQSVKLRFLA